MRLFKRKRVRRAFKRAEKDIRSKRLVACSTRPLESPLQDNFKIVNIMMETVNGRLNSTYTVENAQTGEITTINAHDIVRHAFMFGTAFNLNFGHAIHEYYDENPNDHPEFIFPRGHGRVRLPILAEGGIITKDQHDVSYPHVCFSCKEPLQYEHTWSKFLDQQEPTKQYREAWNKYELYEISDDLEEEGMKLLKSYQNEFDTLWESKHVEFYCCECYASETKKEKKC